MTIYISGPMTGLPDGNYPAFMEAAARYRALGHTVENPAESPKQSSWEDYMRLALKQIANCTGMAMLPGWQKSRGARIEHFLAIELGLSVIYELEAA